MHNRANSVQARPFGTSNWPKYGTFYVCAVPSKTTDLVLCIDVSERWCSPIDRLQAYTALMSGWTSGSFDFINIELNLSATHVSVSKLPGKRPYDIREVNSHACLDVYLSTH